MFENKQLFLWTQDRDELVEFDGVLYETAAIKDGVLYGFNLNCAGHLLGTFDSIKEVLDEIGRILECEGTVYPVSGYEEWGDWETITDMMLEGEEAYEMVD